MILYLYICKIHVNMLYGGGKDGGLSGHSVHTLPESHWGCK